MSTVAPELSPPQTQLPNLFQRFHRWGVQHPKIYYIMPPSVWAVWVYVTCLMPSNKLPHWHWTRFHGFDKVVHISYFALTALLLIRGWHREKVPPWDLHLLVWILCLVFGLMIEIFQGFTPTRGFEWMDVAADGVGAILGLGFWHLLMMKFGKRTKLYPGFFRPDFKDSPANMAAKNK